MVKGHVQKRFEELAEILDYRKSAIVIFPGNSAKDHYLGSGIAKGAWSDKEEYDLLINFIGSRISQLQKKYGDRIRFGAVGFKELLIGSTFLKDWIADPSVDVIHVWGANDGNWNTPNNTSKKILGAGQASVLYQSPGVFGIITMPSKETSIYADDINKHSYYEMPVQQVAKKAQPVREPPTSWYRYQLSQVKNNPTIIYQLYTQLKRDLREDNNLLSSIFSVRNKRKLSAGLSTLVATMLTLLYQDRMNVVHHRLDKYNLQLIQSQPPTFNNEETNSDMVIILMNMLARKNEN